MYPKKPQNVILFVLRSFGVAGSEVEGSIGTGKTRP